MAQTTIVITLPAFPKMSKRAHQSLMVVSAVIAASAAGFSAYGPGLGVPAVDITYAESASVAILTVLRAISGSTDAPEEGKP